MDIISLCRSAQACHLWNILALDGSNWQEVDLFDFQRDVKVRKVAIFPIQPAIFQPIVVENLARRCGGFLKQLSLKGCENVQVEFRFSKFPIKFPTLGLCSSILHCEMRQYRASEPVQMQAGYRCVSI